MVVGRIVKIFGRGALGPPTTTWVAAPPPAPSPLPSSAGSAMADRGDSNKERVQHSASTLFRNLLLLFPFLWFMFYENLASLSPENFSPTSITSRWRIFRQVLFLKKL